MLSLRRFWILILAVLALGMSSTSGAGPTQPHTQAAAPQSSTPLEAELIAQLKDVALEPAAQLGYSVAVSGDIAVVGAPKADDFDGTPNIGSVLIFYRNHPGADSWGLRRILFAPAPAANNEYGSAVAIDGDMLVVGARYTDGGGHSDAGAAFVYRHNNEVWTFVKQLTASDASAGAQAGSAVAISGDTIVVGAPGATGVLSNTGSAYVFRRNTGGADTWGPQAKLTASDGKAGDQFGTSVAIDGDIAVVGAHQAAVSINDSQGAAYLFYRNTTGADLWGQQAKLISPLSGSGGQFGDAVAISGDTLVVGAPATDVGGIDQQGLAFVYSRNEGGINGWGQVKQLAAPEAVAGTSFGNAVAISGDTILVGASGASFNRGQAYLHERNEGGADDWGRTATIMPAGVLAVGAQFGFAVALDGTTILSGAYNNASAGVAYLYARPIRAWPQLLKQASAGAANDNFGTALALDNDTLVVGAPFADAGQQNTGAAYLFERNEDGPDTWELVHILIAPDAAAEDHFGTSVSIADDTVVIGAPDRSGGAGGVYIFVRNQGGLDAWGWKDTLDGAAGEQLGRAVAISGDTIAAGAPTPAAAGGVVFYERNQGGLDAWGEVRRISGGGTGGQFGAALDLDRDRLLVGAPYADPSGATDAGTAYIYERNQGGLDAWGLVVGLSPNDRKSTDHFGSAVALDDSTAAVGSPDQDPSGAVDGGMAYIFTRNQGGANVWGMKEQLVDVDGAAGNRFGFAIDLYDDMLAVGAPRTMAGSNTNQGTILVFKRNEGGTDGWDLLTRLFAEDGAAEDRFGYAVTLGSEHLAAGAIWADIEDSGTGLTSAARPVNANQGAIYLFRAASDVPYFNFTPLINDADLSR